MSTTIDITPTLHAQLTAISHKIINITSTYNAHNNVFVENTKDIILSVYDDDSHLMHVIINNHTSITQNTTVLLTIPHIIPSIVCEIIDFIRGNKDCGASWWSHMNDKFYVVLVDHMTFVPTLRSLLCNDIHDIDASHRKNSVGDGDSSCVSLQDRWWFVEKQVELLKLADEYRSADALYVYNCELIKSTIIQLKERLSVINRFFYAVKANSHPSVLRVVADCGVGFECVSVPEINRVMTVCPELDRNRILFTPNFAGQHEYTEVLTKYRGAFVTVDNLWVLQEWSEVFRDQDVLIRIDPGRGAGHHAHVRTSGSRSKFGVTVDELLRFRDSMPCRVVGLHIHVGSGVYDTDNWTKNAELLTSLCSHFPDVKFINLGGGLGIPYNPNETWLNIEQVNASIAQFTQQQQSSSPVELWMEPGRYFVSEAGVLLGRVTQLKSKPGRDFVGMSCGMNALIRPALYESYHHIMNLTRIHDKHTWTVDVVGPVCETGDVLGHDRKVPESTQSGDWMIVACAGAYGYCMSSDYNMRHASIVEAIFE